VVRRSLPDQYLPGRPLGVTNRISPEAQVSAYALEDQVPAGWAVTQITDNGIYDSANHKVKWGPFFDAAERILAYQLTPASNAVGQAVLASVGSFDGRSGIILGTGAILCQINHAPVAGNDQLQRPPNLPLVISEAQLLANDADLEGSALAIQFTDQTSQFGAAITHEGNQITYTPPAGMNERDSFAYVVVDNQGKVATGVVTIVVDTQLPLEVKQVLNSLDIVPLPQGGVRVTFQGVPLCTYEIQATSDFTQPNWTTLGTGVTQESGLMTYEDPEAAQYPMRFYRALAPCRPY
jgi:hypothetical protein